MLHWTGVCVAWARSEIYKMRKMISLLRGDIALCKRSKVLICEDVFFQALTVERTLNKLGFFRIAPFCSFDELWSVIEYSKCRFELVIVNQDLIKAQRNYTRYDLYNHPCVERLMTYDVVTTYSFVGAEIKNGYITLGDCQLHTST